MVELRHSLSGVWCVAIAAHPNAKEVAVAREVEIRTLGAQRRDVSRTAFGASSVDLGTQIDCRLPTQIVVWVCSTRHPDVLAAEPSSARARKEKQHAVL